MPKARAHFICRNCRTSYNRWGGKCENCGEWNTLVEENIAGGIGAVPGKKIIRGRVIDLVSIRNEVEDAPGIPTNISELDRVTGGGFVKGSAILIGGNPGIGKSTLLMQTSVAFCRKGYQVVYISGEESIAQIQLRARRLGITEGDILLATETSVENILTTLNEKPSPTLLIIDSIQTLWTEMAESSPGSVTQVRASAQSMINYAKKTGTIVILVGHVTKDGQIAGPRVVEHMVDAVLYFEGERGHHFRILRTVKNRFGPTNEIGTFEMTGKGLKEINNPSELFLGKQIKTAPGTAVFAGIEGTRPVLVEIQALVAPSSLGTPRRAVVGWDTARLSMIIAVLEAHCAIRFGTHDVYLNIAGGYRISEPAGDLAAAAALISSFSKKSLPEKSVYFGEISLSGNVRSVSQYGQRLKESYKLGFSKAIVPDGIVHEKTDFSENAIQPIRDLVELAAIITGFPHGKAKKSE